VGPLEQNEDVDVAAAAGDDDDVLLDDDAGLRELEPVRCPCLQNVVV